MVNQILLKIHFIKRQALFWLLLSACLLMGSQALFSQYAVPLSDYTSSDIEQRLQQGQKLALRDLANVWLKQPNDKTLKDLANRYLLLTEEEFDWSKTNLPEQLLHIFYKNEKELYFSEFLGIFYLTPIEDWPTHFQIKDWHPPVLDLHVGNKIEADIAIALKNKDYALLESNLLLLKQLDEKVSDEILANLASNKKLLKLKPEPLKQSILLSIFRKLSIERAINLIFELSHVKKISPDMSRFILADITNYYFEGIPIDSLQLRWKTILEENKNSAAIARTKGYEQLVNARTIFFEEPVDYYAWILATTSRDSMPWAHNNALKDMVATHHPRVLFYLAGLQFKAWKRGIPTTVFLNQLEKITDVRIAVEDQNCEWTHEYKDPTARLNFLIYWSKHYLDYEWSEGATALFTNILQSSAIIDSYERYFRRLNSPNDSAALKAFYLLIEGKPNEINRLMKKYRTLLRTYNATLPPLEFNIIENLCHLTHYCKKYHFDYRPTPSIQEQLKKLASDLTPKERYQIENQLIDNLKLNELTMLEYWGATKAHHIALNYSIGRILDYLYVKYWPDIIQSEREFRFYLLKSALYKRLSNFGIARLFATKIADFDENTNQLLQDIAQSERNEFIRETIQDVKENNSTTIKQVYVKDLIDAPEDFDNEAIPDLPRYTPAELKAYFAALKTTKNRKALRKMEKYMSTHASTDVVPVVFSYSKEDWQSNKSASKIIIKILEKIYGYSFSKKTDVSLEAWYDLWDTQPDDYPNWKKHLFELQLKELEEKDQLKINNINSITQSEYYQPEHRTICLEALKKVKKVRTVTKLHIAPLISVKKELHYLKEIAFSHRDLDDLDKILEIDDVTEFLTFVLQQSIDFPIDQKGFLLNNLLRQKWLFQKIHLDSIDNRQQNTMSEFLRDYLRESTYLTEFEEQAAQLNLLSLTYANKPLANKIKVLDNPTLEDEVKLKWLDIVFSMLEFDKIPQILSIGTQLKDFDKAILFEYISKEFGIPINQWEDKQVVAKFKNQLQTLSKLDLYKYYLNEFGIDFLNRKKKIDLNKIYNILQFDLVVPFLGEGGQYRDIYVYAIIKVLELEFGTTLGFSPKLNEYQTFFQFNSFARANAWIAYLTEHKHVKEHKHSISSFNFK